MSYSFRILYIYLLVSIEGSYSVGTVGYEDVPCDRLRFTYVRCSCSALDNDVRRHADEFADAMKTTTDGKISLQFYEKKKSHWPFGEASTTWEVWTTRIRVVQPMSDVERERMRDRVERDLADMVATVATAVNRVDYVPKVPNEKELANVFDVHYREVNPYLHAISFQLGDEPPHSGVAGTLRKMIREIAY